MTPTNESEERHQGFVEYLEAHLARHNWTVDQLAEKSGMSPSVIFRWRHGFVPNIKNARLFAKAVGVPVMDVLIKSGQITREEAGAGLFTLDEVETPVLARELTRRIEAAAERAREIAAQVATDEPDDGIDERSLIVEAILRRINKTGRPDNPSTSELSTQQKG